MSFETTGKLSDPLAQDQNRGRGKAWGAQRYKAMLLTVGFLILIIMPSVDQWLEISSRFKSTEKRILAPFPEFRFPHVKTFIHKFNQYYKENFGWRNALFFQYSRWKYHVLGSSPLPEKAIIGKQGWFYPGNSLGQIVDRHKGLMPLRQDTLSLITKRLTNYQRELAKQGIQFYVLIAPDSYSIYPEYVPDDLQLERTNTNLDRFKAYVTKHSSIPLVDVRQELLAGKSDHIVYYQTDTHWNNYGSLIASLALANRIRQDFPQIPKPLVADYTIKPIQGEGGDLVTMLAMNQEFRDSVEYKIRPAAYLTTQLKESLPNPESGLPTQRFVGQATNMPKLLLLGDSFSFSMNQFLPGYFRESYIKRTSHFDRSLVQAEKPDVVVVEIVERNITWLAKL